MSRPKGSKNKGPRRDTFITALRKLFSKQIIADILKLSTDSGISLKEVCQDMAVEGIAACRIDGYAQIIKFRANRGKVYRDSERTAGRISPPAAREESQPESLPEETGGDIPEGDAGVLFPEGDAGSVPAGANGPLPSPVGRGQSGPVVKDSGDAVYGSGATLVIDDDEGIDTDLPL